MPYAVPVLHLHRPCCCPKGTMSVEALADMLCDSPPFIKPPVVRRRAHRFVAPHPLGCIPPPPPPPAPPHPSLEPLRPLVMDGFERRPANLAQVYRRVQLIVDLAHHSAAGWGGVWASGCLGASARGHRAACRKACVFTCPAGVRGSTCGSIWGQLLGLADHALWLALRDASPTPGPTHGLQVQGNPGLRAQRIECRALTCCPPG